GEDKIGNKFDKECVLFVGGNTLALGNVIAFPNPFNPNTTDLTLAFDNVKAANISVEVFDWNGDKVSSIGKTLLPAGRNVIKWAGQSEEGTPLANGVYLARIDANDGTRTVTQVLKIAVWHE
ncbi:MAG: hypothetical protein FD129_267, partial [bacterium]